MNELSHSLITEITNSAIIKQGLFPAPGTKSQPSNTAVKNDYLWMLCEAVFEEHPDYEKVFPKIQSNAEHKKSWTLKMKNKLAWAIVEADCPYFFELRALIGEGLNLVPVGLSNNDTPVDIFTILPGIDGQGYDSSSDFLGWDFGDGIGAAETEEDIDEKDNGFDGNITEDAKKYTHDLDSQGSDIEDDSVEAQVPTKRKVGVSVKTESVKKMKKNGPLPGKSTPAPKPMPSNLKKKSLAEEETAQKRIELRKEKVVAEKDMKVASVKAKAAIEMKAQYALEKMQLEHQYCLAELQAQNGMAAGSSHGPGVIVQPMAASGSSSKLQGSLGSNLGTPFSFNELDLPQTNLNVSFQFRP
ncbi:hypothetical protein L208DRAFT_1375666 [Tricholoma matsutake]|nr:hypothetical protein L208DRAFT_1375666 [Tricholoma matsutake 945]